MDEAKYKAWWPLHLRTAKREPLSPEEQVFPFVASIDEMLAMTNAELEKRLNNEERFGFVGQFDLPGYLSWVLLFKRRTSAVTPFDPIEEGERFLQWEKQMKVLSARSYFVHVIEQKRDIYECAEYENTEDFGVKEHHSFATLEDAVAFLDRAGYTIDSIKTGHEIGAP